MNAGSSVENSLEPAPITMSRSLSESASKNRQETISGLLLIFNPEFSDKVNLPLLFMYNLDGKLAAPPIKRSLSLSLSTSPQQIDGPLIDCLFGNRGCNSKSSKVDSLCIMLSMFLFIENMVSYENYVYCKKHNFLGDVTML